MSGSVDVLDVWPVIEFRPLPGYFNGVVRRYADGEWLPDDGEYDLAFIGDTPFPCSLFVDLPYQRNIIAGWCSDSWRDHVEAHPGGNAWHYHLRAGKRSWGGDWGRERHPNTRAGNAGMNKICGEQGCANGRSVSPTDIFDQHIGAGLVRERVSQTILRLPRNLRCMYCKDAGTVALARREAA